LFRLLDGLPLAIAQAGAYLQESGVGVRTYLKFYEQQWTELMESRSRIDAPLQDYPDRSVWTTWTISFNVIQTKDKNVANLLLLWAFLDNKDLWHGLFSAACRASTIVKRRLSEWIGDIASNEIEFIKAIQLLRNYSLLEDIEDLASYATHPVIHRWAYHIQSKKSRVELAQLAVIMIEWAVPDSLSRDYSIMQRRLLSHAQVCSRWVLVNEIGRRTRSRHTNEMEFEEPKKKEAILDAILLLGNLYNDQDKLAEAEKMYERALKGYEDAIGLENVGIYKPALNTMWNRGDLYVKRGELTQAREAYSGALMGFQIILGPSSNECQKIKAAFELLNFPPGKTRCVANFLTQALITSAGTNNSRGPPVGIEAPKIAHVEITKKPKLSARRLFSKLFR